MKDAFKKVISVLSIAVLLTALAACGNSEPEEKTTDPTTTEPEKVVTTTEAPTEAIKGKGSLNGSDVEILNAEMAEDYKGNPCVVITYKWKNTSNDATAFSYSVNCSAYQNGVELSRAHFVGNDVVDTQALLNKVKPGVEIEIKDAYVITDESADIEVEVKDWVSLEGDPVITKTFSLK